jgi:acyl-CoA thioesterase
MVRKKLSSGEVEEIGGFNDLIDIRNVYEENGELFVSVKVEDKHTNPFGIAHGGFIFSLCDTAAGSYSYYKNKTTVTLDSNIQYYKPGKVGDTLTAKAIPRKEGRNISVILVEVVNQKNEKIADATLTTVEVKEKQIL